MRINTEHILERIKKIPDIEGEVFSSEIKGTTIEVSETHCEKFNMYHDCGMGVRILKDRRWGIAYATQTDDIDTIIDRAIANAEHNVADVYNILSPAKKQNIPDDQLQIYDREIERLSSYDKIQLLLDLEAKALTSAPMIKKVLTAAYADSIYEQCIMNTRGVAVNWQETFFTVALELKAEQNTKIQVGGDSQSKRFFQELDFPSLVQRAVFRTVKMLGAKSIPTQKIPVIFDPYVSCEFLALVASAVNADNIQKTKSPFLNKLHTKIAADFIQVIDDGILSRGVGTSPYDDEGIPTQRNEVIKEGVLQCFLYDSYTANKDKKSSTGNASRGSFMSSPGVGVNNFYLEKGIYTSDELIQSVAKGLYVVEVMGMHTTDPITGDFSVGVSGLWIENGQFAYPVQGVAMAGNIMTFLENIAMVGSDLRFYGNVGSPTIKIKEMMISGT